MVPDEGAQRPSKPLTTSFMTKYGIFNGMYLVSVSHVLFPLPPPHPPTTYILREEHMEVRDLYLRAAQMSPDQVDADVQVCVCMCMGAHVCVCVCVGAHACGCGCVSVCVVHY